VILHCLSPMEPWVRQRFSFFVRSLSVVILTLCCACDTQPSRDTTTILQDQAAPPHLRVSAMRQLGQDPQVTDDQLWQLLEPLLYANRQAASIRIAALTMLADRQPERLRISLRHRLATISDWAVLEAALALMVKREWSDCLGGVVRSYARASQRYDDDARIEREAVRVLGASDDVVSVLWTMVDNPEGFWTAREQMDAWLLLTRLETASGLREQLASLSPQSVLVADLQAAMHVVDRLPATRDEMLWMYQLRQDPVAWPEIQRAVAGLSPSQREGLALRHLPTLRFVAREQGRRAAAGTWPDRQQLLSPLRTHVAASQRVLRTRSRQWPDPVDERLETHEAMLSWGDLLVLEQLTRVMRDPAVVAALFIQADADLADKTSEHGGVLAFAGDGRVEALAFEPYLRGNDERYVSPPQLFPVLFERGLAHYHFHAQSHRHSDYAGPGEGDFEFAQRIACNCVVLTFIDPNRLNVDFFVAGPIAVDLGTITRR